MFYSIHSYILINLTYFFTLSYYIREQYSWCYDTSTLFNDHFKNIAATTVVNMQLSELNCKIGVPLWLPLSLSLLLPCSARLPPKKEWKITSVTKYDQFCENNDIVNTKTTSIDLVRIYFGAFHIDAEGWFEKETFDGIL